MKISQFKANTHLDVDLVDAVINQMGGKSAFKESAQDVANHGIDGGFHGFIYYTDTVAFAQANKALIMALADQQADEYGAEGSLAMIRQFGCLKSGGHQSDPEYTETEIAQAIYDGSEDETQVLNALAWYAAEEVCRAYVDCCEYLEVA